MSTVPNIDITFPSGPYNDTYNARVFTLVYQDKILWAKNYGGWFIYNGSIWELDQNDKIKLQAIKIFDAMRTYGDKFSGDGEMHKLWKRHIVSTGADSSLNSMINCAKAFLGIEVQFDKETMKLNCKNGVLDLLTLQLRDNEPKDYTNKICEASYDKSAECPLWKKFVDDIFLGDKEIIDFVQRVIGYGITGITDEQCFFIFWGTGSNGKGTFIETLNFMMGDYATTCNADSLMSKTWITVPNDIARLNGARFVSASEHDKNVNLDEAMIKKLTGQDRILARYLHKEFFEFYPKFKIFLSTNHKPNIRGTDTGIWRRVKMIPFSLNLEDKPSMIDRKLRWKLKEEINGILNWAIEGCKKWQEKGLVMPKKIEEAILIYRKEEDKIGQFIDAECITQTEFEENVKGMMLMCPISLFRDKLFEFLGHKINQKILREYMAMHGYIGDTARTIHNDKQVRTYINISLRDMVAKSDPTVTRRVEDYHNVVAGKQDEIEWED